MFLQEKIRGNIKILREKAELSQIELAKRVGVQTSTLVSWERKKAMPSLIKALKLLKVCNSTIKDLIE